MNDSTPTTAALAVFDKILNPMEAVEKLGTFIARSGMAGCEKVEQGMVLAMACLTERRSPLDIIREYHIIDGKLSMKSEAMLAKFNQHGGRHLWVQSDDKAAVLRLTHGAFKDFEVGYTMQDAERAGLVGKGGARRAGQNKDGGWQKNPDAMLRARCTSKAIRMVDPTVVVGIYTPEEIIDERIEVAGTSQARSLLTPPPHPATPTPAGDPPLPEAVDTPGNMDKDEREVHPTDEGQNPLLDALAGMEQDAEGWLRAHGWLGTEQPLESLPAERVKEIMSRLANFKRAVRTWKSQQKPKEG